MKFRDLPKRDTCIKLSVTSFSSPRKNLEVFKFINSIKPFQDYIAQETSKILQKYGHPSDDGMYTVTGKENVDAYYASLNEVLEIDISELDVDIFSPNLNIEDFEEENCQYPNDKSLWLNASDIDSVINFSKKINEELKNKD